MRPSKDHGSRSINPTESKSGLSFFICTVMVKEMYGFVLYSVSTMLVENRKRESNNYFVVYLLITFTEPNQLILDIATTPTQKLSIVLPKKGGLRM